MKDNGQYSSKFARNAEVKEEVIRRLDDFIHKVNKLSEEEESIAHFKDEILNSIEQTKKDACKLDAKRIFVSCFGALKAGKSTLVNALAGRKVSPMGYGQETTLRCSAIIKADEDHPEGITFYKLTQAVNDRLLESLEKDDGQESFLFEKYSADILYHLMGAMSDEEIRKEFEKSDKYPINEEYLSCLTCENPIKISPFQNFILAEIRINLSCAEDCLLQKDVVLWDMPGLDGILANVDKNDISSKIISEILYKTHFFLFIQSSITALNDTSKSTLEKVVSRKKDVPRVLVLNRIDGKGWLTPEHIEDELEKRDADSRKLYPFFDNSLIVNAAKAWDSLNASEMENEDFLSEYQGEEGRSKLSDESGIAKLRKEIIDKGEACSGNIIFNDAMNSLTCGLQNNILSKVDLFEGKAINQIKALDNTISMCNGALRTYDELKSEEVKSIDKMRKIIVDELTKEGELKDYVDNIEADMKRISLPEKKGILKDELEKELKEYIISLDGTAKRAIRRDDFIEICEHNLRDAFDFFCNKVKGKFIELEELERLIDEVYHNVENGMKAIFSETFKDLRFGYANVNEFVSSEMKDLSKFCGMWRRIGNGIKKLVEIDSKYDLSPQKAVAVRERYLKTFKYERQLEAMAKACFAPMGEQSAYKEIVGEFTEKFELEIHNLCKGAKEQKDGLENAVRTASELKKEVKRFAEELQKRKESC